MRINRRAADRLLSGHVWVYRSDLDTDQPPPQGVPVAVLDAKGRLLGTALSSSHSQIALRLIAREMAEINQQFFEHRLRRAWALRREIVEDTDACRMVFSEADQLPGLIIDQYANVLSIQLLTQGMDAFQALILDAVRAVASPTGIVFRHDAPVRQKEGLPGALAVWGEVPDTVDVRMNGRVWVADLRHGQKTGLFLDQRENYRAAERHACGRALDCFTSSGGFALHLAGRCESVEAVDASETVLARARLNAERNGVQNVQFRASDVFDVLAQKAAGGARYGTIVLDPPAFAKSKASIDKALAGYREINTRALRMLDPGGVLITCSCSQHVSEADFFEMLAQASRDAGRTLRIRERRTQAADHPVLLTVPETLYLKCVIAEVLP